MAHKSFTEVRREAIKILDEAGAIPSIDQIREAEREAAELEQRTRAAKERARELRVERYEATRDPTPSEAIFMEVHQAGLRVKCPREACAAQPDQYCHRPDGSECPMHIERMSAGRAV